MGTAEDESHATGRDQTEASPGAIREQREDSLLSDEKQMFKFPRACLVCHNRRDNRLLEDCQDCASVSLCKRHEDSAAHMEHTCSLLKLCFNLDRVLSVSVNDLKSTNLNYLQRISNEYIFRDT